LRATIYKSRIEHQISNTSDRKDIPINVFKKSKMNEEKHGGLRQKGRNDTGEIVSEGAECIHLAQDKG